jgi:hypothetical protein
MMFKRTLHSPLDLSWQRNGNAIHSILLLSAGVFHPEHCALFMFVQGTVSFMGQLAYSPLGGSVKFSPGGNSTA